MRWYREFLPKAPEDLYGFFAFMEEGEERIQATYRDHYDRLVRIKTKYDPDNRFPVNHNIKPSA